MSEQDKSKIASLQDDHDPDISEVYRQSAQDLPPASLDDQILRAAHAAVTPQEEAPIKSKPRRQWPLLGALAASVLVAVLAVKLLPYSVRSPSPEMKERATSKKPAVDSVAPKSAAPARSTGIGSMQGVPSGLPEQRVQDDEVGLNRAEQPARAAEPYGSASDLQNSHDATPSGAATLMPDETDADASSTRNKEFNKIVELWETGNIEEAIKRFAAFQKQFPDYTPNPQDEAVYQTLQSELRSQPLPEDKDAD